MFGMMLWEHKHGWCNSSQSLQNAKQVRELIFTLGRSHRGELEPGLRCSRDSGYLEEKLHAIRSVAWHTMVIAALFSRATRRSKPVFTDG
jgi:hypothetical protein